MLKIEKLGVGCIFSNAKAILKVYGKESKTYEQFLKKERVNRRGNVLKKTARSTSLYVPNHVNHM